MGTAGVLYWLFLTDHISPDTLTPRRAWRREGDFAWQAAGPQALRSQCLHLEHGEHCVPVVPRLPP